MSTDGIAVNVEPAADALLSRQRRGAIELVTLNRPKARNSLSVAMMAALHQTLEEIASDPAIKVMVLAANGPAFCAGHDLKELAPRRRDKDGGRAFFEEVMASCCALMQAVVELPQPVIAAVHGVATAAGCQLVASCDLAVAGETARFATPGVDIGLFCSTPMVALSRSVSTKHAMEMLLTGEMQSAQDAMRMGLVNRVVADGAELDEALSLAEKIASKSPHALRVGKQAFYKQREMSLSQAYAYTAKIMVENLMAKDADEGICAFLEKRSPEWNNKNEI